MLNSDDYSRSFMKGNPGQYKYDIFANTLCVSCVNPNGLTKDLNEIIAKILAEEKNPKLRAILYRDKMCEWYKVHTESANSEIELQNLGTRDISTAFFLITHYSENG